MHLIAAVVCLLIGIGFPLLLNGQTFTNSVLGIVFAGAAVGLAWDWRDYEARRTARRIVAVLGVLLGVVLVAQLPSAYRFQRGFNRRVEQLRQRRQQGGGGGKVNVPRPAAGTDARPGARGGIPRSRSPGGPAPGRTGAEGAVYPPWS
jgi:hypothetical protein